jgi:transposase
MVNHIFVGIDLGDKNSVARIAVNRGKAERMAFVKDRRGRSRLFEEVRRRAEQWEEAQIIMAYEASSCGYILSDEAEAREIRCWVLAPTKMEKSVEQRKHKNDDRDADDVVEKVRAHVLAGNRLPTVWIPDRQMRDDRELVRSRMELVEKQTRLKTQIQMLVKRHGLEKPSGCGAGWTVRYRQWLQALTECDALRVGARAALQSLLRQLSFLEDEIERMEKPIRELAQQPRHKPIIDELTQEHGVGLITAMVYRTEIGHAGRFRRGRRVGKFVGLTPTSHESGQQQDRKGHISRQGPPRLRKMLCQASWVHVQRDPQAKRFYQQLVSRNPKKKKIAIVAVMRRLAVRLWHRMRAAEIRMRTMAEMN